MKNNIDDNKWINDNFEDNLWEEKDLDIDGIEEDFHEDNFEEDTYEEDNFAVRENFVDDIETSCFGNELWEEPIHEEEDLREASWEEGCHEEGTWKEDYLMDEPCRERKWEDRCCKKRPCREREWEDKCCEDKCWEERPCRERKCEDRCWKERPCRERKWEERCWEERPCRKPCCEDCSKRKCSSSCEDQCRYTIAEILKKLARHSCDVPVTVYLNVPGELDFHNQGCRTNLRVANNANVQGNTAAKTVSIAGTGNIPAGAIQVRSTGTVDVPGLDINPADARTVEGVFMPISISSQGSVIVDFSEGSAAGTIAPIEVRGTAAGQTITVPISAFDTLRFNAGGVDFVDIPSLEVCCTPCSGGRSSNDSACGCLRFRTEPVRLATEGKRRFIELPVSVTGESTANVRSTAVTGSTVQSTVSLGLSGQVTAPVTVEAEAGSSALVPRLGVQGRTAGAPGVALASTGGNTSAVPVTTNVSGTIEPIAVTGTAATRGLPVTGTVQVDADIRHAHIKFTGIIECVNGNSVTLREVRTNKKVVISLCDIIKIEFPSFRGIRCMERIFEGNKLDRCSCAYGIQKNLCKDAGKPGYIELYGSGTFNPIAEAINTNNIRIVDGGVLWVAEHRGCRPAMHVIYSLCNVAGYVFSPRTCHKD